MLGSLPPGFSLSSAGLLSGTNTQAGTFNFTVKASAGSCQATKMYTLVLLNGTAALAQRADYDGDGRSDFALWSPTRAWQLSLSNGGAQRQAQTQPWGTTDDLTLLGDYDGDGKTDLAVWRPSTGTWSVKHSRDGQFLVKQWGAFSDVPVAADYDGDGQTAFAVWRVGVWYLWQSGSNSFRVETCGTSAAPTFDQPTLGDYDGDGRVDVAVWRARESTWHVKQSTDQLVHTQILGQLGDRPVLAR